MSHLTIIKKRFLKIKERLTKIWILMIHLHFHLNLRKITASKNVRFVFINIKEFYIFNVVQSFFHYNTPNMISKTVVNKLNIQKNDKIYDPACGIGTIFKDIIDHIGDLHYNLNNLYGNDIDHIAIDIAKFDIGSQNIKKINSLNNNLDYSNKFDVVISDLPYGLKKNNKSITSLFLEHMLDSLKESGRGCVIGSKKSLNEIKEIFGDKITYIQDFGRINNFEYVAVYFSKNKKFLIEI
jgi:tRNA G10  N-methylase Trm11